MLVQWAHFLLKKNRDFSLPNNFSACISPVSKYLKFATFSHSAFCSGEELLHFSNKRDWFGGSAESIKIFLLETFSNPFLLYKEDEKSFLVQNPKEKIELQQ